MTSTVTLGIDIGTSSTKGVLVDMGGQVLATVTREHQVCRPRPGWVEMDAGIWWDEFVTIARELLGPSGEPDDLRNRVAAVGVSGMGPCVLVTDSEGQPLRPAILYGVDMRATAQIERLTAELGGDEAIAARTGSSLSTQAVGPKLAWIADEEPAVFARSRRLFMPSSWLAWKLTDEYLLDHHSASQCWPLYDPRANDWYRPWAEPIIKDIDLPDLRWPGEIAGHVTAAAAAATGIPAGTPVITGTVDAWSEAVSVDAQNIGDLMLMYGTTMFLVNTVPEPITAPGLWGTVGAFPGTHCLAGGMATSGAITAWLRDLFGGVEYTELLELAEASGPGANGLLMLPYFAGERTPVPDPLARGTVLGLTITHTRGDLYRAALEATAFAVRHNVEAMIKAGGVIERIVAVGGGSQGDLWAQIVTDVLGRDQEIPTLTIGASFGAAYLAARTVGEASIRTWNPPRRTLKPDPAVRDLYDERYRLYRQAYPDTLAITHELAATQARDSDR